MVQAAAVGATAVSVKVPVAELAGVTVTFAQLDAAVKAPV